MPNILKGFRMVGSKVIGPVIAANDPYFNYTTLLLPGSGSNGANNNVFVDASTNNFAITRNGNSTQGTFSPFSQTGWSNYFDGSGDYLSLTATSAVQLTNSTAFAIEFWVYPASIPSTGGSAFVLRAYDMSSPFPGYGIAFGGNTLNTNLQFWNGTTWADIGAVSANTWTHVAVTYEGSGTTLRYFINGTQQGSATTVPSNINYTGTPFIIGARNNDFYLNGYLSNLRIVKGSAVYTSNFTPSTTPLTAITNTSLLTCQSNRFIDNSTNAFTITRNGDVSVQAFSPFAPAAAWSAATYGGSGYFDGTGDYLSIADNDAFALGSNDWTIECWVYISTLSAQGFIAQIASNGADTSMGFGLGINASGYPYVASYINGAYTAATASTAIVTNQWNHIAGSRASGTMGVFLNGTRLASTAVSGSSVNSTNTVTVGSSNSGASALTTGYISGARIVNGTAVYSGTTYTLPTAPLTAIANTSLLLNFTNAGIYDATGKNNLETVGNAQISNITAKFGSTSIYMAAATANTDYLVMPASRNVQLGSGDFTIEFWMRPDSVTTSWANSNLATMLDLDPSAGTGTDWWVIHQVNNTVQFASNAAIILTSSASLVATTWQYIALVRSGSGSNNLTFYINGTASGSATYTATIGGNRRLFIGTQQGSSRWYKGYIQDLRVTKGYARYTANFTPATAVFPVL